MLKYPTNQCPCYQTLLCVPQADEPMTLEMFYTFDLGRLGPYVPPMVEMDTEQEAESLEEGEEEEGGEEED